MTSDDEELKPQKSKNQQKREAEAAQALGTELVDLPASQFKALIEKLELPEKLHEALAACRSIKAREGRRRQLQFIGKLMRTIETAPIEQKLAELKRGGQIETAQLHHVERWRERLLTEGDEAVSELIQRYPQIDTTQVRQLIANARKETSLQKPPRSARKLFKYLREMLAD